MNARFKLPLFWTESSSSRRYYATRHWPFISSQICNERCDWQIRWGSWLGASHTKRDPNKCRPLAAWWWHVMRWPAKIQIFVLTLSWHIFGELFGELFAFLAAGFLVAGFFFLNLLIWHETFPRYRSFAPQTVRSPNMGTNKLWRHMSTNQQKGFRGDVIGFPVSSISRNGARCLCSRKLISESLKKSCLILSVLSEFLR